MIRKHGKLTPTLPQSNNQLRILSFQNVLINSIPSRVPPGLCDAERFRHGGERPREASEAVPASDLRYGAVASQQQVG